MEQVSDPIQNLQELLMSRRFLRFVNAPMSTFNDFASSRACRNLAVGRLLIDY